MDVQEFRCCFGGNLRRLRKSKGLTQSELAEKIGIETHNLNRIENGKSFPQAKTIVNIISYFDILPYELFMTNNDRLEHIADVILKNPEKINDIYKIIIAITSENEDDKSK
ncbi:MAG: helix-turn-helix domain-containing protein [Muribaculaceae bacterium]|nr:helix-turn-helix domain-containing protein [Muribaculaceae bacterium]